jgi:Tol biopolymer transport system component
VAFARGAILGHYEIVDLVGRGGMGEVYRARDLRLGRFVAIKVIAPALADRADVQRRFEEECRVAATLDHPRICAVHDAGRDGGVLYLVMEFLEGESLAQKIARGPLGRAEVLGYAIEIADAVQYAHGHGVVHRDLKPANVFITPAGVKVLDFGLAKLRQGDAPPTAEAAGERTAQARTIEGSVFGTAHYLPPERLEGKPADERSDIFGFGTIVYEMATGRRAFDAATPAALIAAILTTDPPPLPAASPTGDLDWIVRRCLARNPDDRWQSLGDVETVLKWIARSGATPATAAGGARRAHVPLVLLASLAILALAAAAFLVTRPRTGARAPAPVAFTIRPPPGSTFTPTESSVESAQLAVSPDGREVAFVAAGANGISQLWIRPLDAIDARPIAGTEGATYPFWSPDGRALGFFVLDELKRIDRRGGPATVLAAAPNGRGGTWNANGVILFAPNANGPLRSVREDGTGGADQTTLATDRDEKAHRWPQFLPDGRHFIWFVRNSEPSRTGIFLGSLDSPETTMLVRTTSSAQYAPPGRLLYVVDGTLLAANLDVAARRLVGESAPVAARVGTSSNFYSAVSVSATGVLAYAERAVAPEELAWIDRKGQKLGSAATRSRYVDFRISPDARHVAIAGVDQSSDRPEISVLNLARGTSIRLTTSPATDASPVWSPDGDRLVFRSNRDNVHDLYTRASSGAGADALFLKSASAKSPTDWSRSGLIVYQSNNEHTRWDIYAAPSSNPGGARPLADSQFIEVQGQVSPDERWLAYTSNESGTPEVYLKALWGTALKLPVSTHGAAEPEWHGAGDPRWRADGHELFYVTNEGSLMAVALRDGPGGMDMRPAQRLFRLAHAPIAPPYTSAYDPAPDGSRFLVRIRGDDSRTLPITVLVNWTVR